MVLVLGLRFRGWFFDIVDPCFIPRCSWLVLVMDGVEIWHEHATCFAVGVTEYLPCAGFLSILRMDDSLSSEVRASGECLGA